MEHQQDHTEKHDEVVKRRIEPLYLVVAVGLVIAMFAAALFFDVGEGDIEDQAFADPMKGAAPAPTRVVQKIASSPSEPAQEAVAAPAGSAQETTSTSGEPAQEAAPASDEPAKEAASESDDSTEEADETSDEPEAQPVSEVAPVLPTTLASYTSSVGELLQNDIMLGGCELVSLGIVLDSMGVDEDLDDLVEGYLDTNGSFGSGYAGDPYWMGGGYAPGIAAAANLFFAENGWDYRAHDVTGLSFDELSRVVELGYPVLVWSTMGLEDAEYTGIYDEDYEWYDNEHCVVLYGFEGDQALVSDPLDGLVERDIDRFADVYEQCGNMAIVIF